MDKTKLFINWVKQNQYFVIFVAIIVSLFFLWLFRGSIEIFLPLILNIAVLLLATYISLRSERKLGFKITVWIIVLLITSVNTYLYVKEQHVEKLYFDILTPSMTAKEALDLAQNTLKFGSQQYQLIDVVGSYYICFKKPDTFFHRFPEWILVFRNTKKDELLEVRICDGRMPQIPFIQLREFNELYNGRIAMYMKFKVSMAYLGADNIKDENLSDIVIIFDNYARSLIEIRSKGQEDIIPEVVESENSKVFARVRSVGRATDYCNQWTVVESLVSLGKTFVYSARYSADSFYKSLSPITDWGIDVEDAIKVAIAAGAQAIPPGKFGQSGGPGVFRLNSSRKRNLKGIFWQLPFRVKISPILVDAKNGDVFAIDSFGNYSNDF